MKHFKKLLAFILSTLLVLSALPMWVSAEEYGSITIDTPFTVIPSEGTVYYTFTPDKTGFYNIASLSQDENCDPMVYIYKGSTADEAMGEADDDIGKQFDKEFFLIKGTVYYFGFKDWSYYELGYSVTLTYKGEMSYVDINLNDTKTVNIESNGQILYYKFVPESDGYYSLYSEGEYDTFCTLYDEEMAEISINDDANENTNFELVDALTAETVYYYGVRMLYSSTTGEFTVTLKEVPEPEGLHIGAEEITAYVGQIVRVDYSLSPADAFSDITVDFSDENVTSSVDIYDESFEFLCEKEGTADVTVSTANGIEKTFKLNVMEVPAVALEDGKTVSMSESAYNGAYHFTFVPQTSGEYVYAASGNVLHNLYIYNSYGYNLLGCVGTKQNQVVELQEGEEYHIRLWTEHYSSDWQIVMAKSQAPESVKIDGGDFTAYVEGEGTLSVSTEPFYAVYETVEWSSSDTDVLEVYSDGSYSAIGTGTVTVTAEIGVLSDSITVTVSDGEELTLAQPETATITEERDFYRFVFTPEEDGTYAFYSDSEMETYAELYDANGIFIDCDSGSYDGLNFYIESEMTAGEKYYLKTNFFNAQTGSFAVTVTACDKVTPVSAVVSKMPYKTEYVKGFLENSFDLSGLELKATLSDGSTENLMIYDWDYDYYFECYENGEIGTVIVSFEGIEVEIPVKLVDSPIKSIEVNPDFSLTLMEGVGVYADYDDNGEMYNRYEYEIPDDFPITVNFNDGTKKNVTLSDMVLGESFYILDNQYEEHWVKGGEYELVLSLYGVEAYIPVYIVENTIISVEMTSAPDITEYVFGDVNYGIMNDSLYIFMPELSGLEFTVNYSDRESKVFAYSKEKGNIGGYYFDYPMCEIPSAGNTTVELEFMGEAFTFDITVKESNVQSIEIISLPTESQYSYYAYFVNPIGMEIKITYTDNTSETVEVTKENLGYIAYYWDEGLLIENGDNDIAVFAPYYSDETYIICNGVRAVLDGVERVDSNITDMTVLELGNEGDGMVVELTYQDGSTKTVTLSSIARNEFSGVVYGWAVTEIGVVNYTVLKSYAVDGSLIYTEVRIFDSFAFIVDTDNKGDCNADGEVNTVDLAVMKLFLAAVGTIDETGADLNGDGEINTVDLAELKLMLAGS